MRMDATRVPNPIIAIVPKEHHGLHLQGKILGIKTVLISELGERRRRFMKTLGAATPTVWIGTGMVSPARLSANLTP